MEKLIFLFCEEIKGGKNNISIEISFYFQFENKNKAPYLCKSGAPFSQRIIFR
jgi:hypothetical protein